MSRRAALSVTNRLASAPRLPKCTCRKPIHPNYSANFSVGHRSYATATEVSKSKLPPRGKYKKLDAHDIKQFESFGCSVITSLEADSTASISKVSDDELHSFNQDWMSKYQGHSKVVLKPKTTQQVSDIIKYCYQNEIAITPQGGNTGLVGGSVPVYDEVIISLAGMDKIRAFDDVSGVITCDAGCILQALDDYSAAKGYMMPLDLGAKGSCQIGGNIATNAGGLRLLRYGSLHGSVLGLEVVLPDENGTIMSVGMGGLRKDNTGYDLKQLFIGSEGTLGIITGASILTPKRSSAVNVALLKMDSFSRVQEVFRETRSHLGEILSAFEFFDQEGYAMVLEHTKAKAPFEVASDADKPFYVLIETSGSNKDHDDEKLGGLLESLLESGTVLDGVLAQDETQVAGLWSLRESIPEAAGKLGKTYKYDLSIPVSQMYNLVLATRQRLEEAALNQDGSVKVTIGYGHVGDSNIHLNVIASKFQDKISDVLEPWVYEWVAQHNGSISAEHGLGLQKAPYIGYSKEKPAIDMMKQIKKAIDSKGIMNPYKYFL